jgi:hypothetical protein
MKDKLILVGLALLLSACAASQGNVDNIRGQTALINFNDSKAIVMEMLGVPGDRSFKGTDEAWQYCSTGFNNDTYATIWFSNNKVTAISSKDGQWAVGSCSQSFPSVDWGQRPADQIIDVNVN